MIAAPENLPRLDPEGYRAYEHGQLVRHELVAGHLHVMTGTSDRHEEIALDLAAACGLIFAVPVECTRDRRLVLTEPGDSLVLESADSSPTMAELSE